MMAFPGGAIRTPPPGGSRPYGFPWADVSRWQPWWDEATAEFGLVPGLLPAMAVVESHAQHYTTGQMTGTRAQVVQGGDRFGDGPAVGIMQIKLQLWSGVLPDADGWTPQGNIRLGAALMRRFIDQVGSWQQAIRQHYHPGTSAAGVTPAMYVETVRSLMEEMAVSDGLPLPYRISLIPVGNRNRPRTAINAGGPRYITVHETGNTSVGANAEMHRRFTHQGGRAVVRQLPSHGRRP